MCSLVVGLDVEECKSADFSGTGTVNYGPCKRIMLRIIKRK